MRASSKVICPAEDARLKRSHVLRFRGSKAKRNLPAHVQGWGHADRVPGRILGQENILLCRLCVERIGFRNRNRILRRLCVERIGF